MAARKKKRKEIFKHKKQEDFEKKLKEKYLRGLKAKIKGGRGKKDVEEKSKGKVRERKGKRDVEEKKKVKEGRGKKGRKREKREHEKIKVLESYEVKLDKTAVNVKIERSETGVLYKVYFPEIKTATSALLDELRKELIAMTTVGVSEMSDIKSILKIKKRFMIEATNLLRKKIPTISKKTEDFLISMLMADMLGLGKLEVFMNDPYLEEIVVVNSKEPVRVYHKGYGWLPTNIKIEREEDINNYSNIIARRVGRQINVLSPLLDAHTVTGDRANAVLYPISTKGNTLTIRKFARDPWTIVDLIENKTCNLEIAALLWLAINYEMNVLFSGGTASGKTVFLNVCMPFIPPNHRIISIEDTREITLPNFLYWCPLVTRTPNPEGRGEVSMLNLLVNSLRMRPDRIILGEIRRQREAEVLFEAMHTGHSVYATVHADSAPETISRLINPPISIPPNLLKAVNLNVVMFRDRKKGIRRVYQVAEFVSSGEEISPNILYRWVPEKDEIIQHTKSINFFEELSRRTGMSQGEIYKELEEKKKILSWLVKNKLRSLEDVGRVMNLYYTNPKLLKEIIKKDDVKKLRIK